MPHAHLRQLAAGLVLLASIGPALAHAHLVRAVPAADATIAQTPTELDLDFSEAVDLAFTGVTVAGPQGSVQVGPAALRANGTTLAVPITGPLAPGAYTVTWHALARDGHKTEGHYGFTLKP
ncbi:copper homeostasis periplasmic binding protein CopC [Methylobacterium fujisawaense]|uniref:copper homeostasis periplasmic binding protein CopC n=1 Tax=Methylobacterium fujisawaense TaxID=107400 RepID=UPI0036F86D11